MSRAMFQRLALLLSLSLLACGDDSASTDAGDSGARLDADAPDARPIAELCDNGEDDDGDGDVDCADRDCLLPELDTTVATSLWDAMRWLVERESGAAHYPCTSTTSSTFPLEPTLRSASTIQRPVPGRQSPTGA